MSKVICLGIMVTDVVAKPVDSVPEKGKLSLVDAVELHTGGCAVNTSIDLAKIGEDVGIIGLVGHDSFGSFLIDTLHKEGVNTKGLKVTKEVNTSVSLVLSGSDGERSFIHCLGSNGRFNESFIDMEVVQDCSILFVAGALLMPSFDGEPTAGILKKAKELGKYTVLDTAWDSTGRWMKDIEPCLPYLDLFIPSIEEAQMLSGKNNEREIAEVFLEKGAKNIVIKLGSKGCYIRNTSEEYYVEAFKVQAVDTNGAGDSFVAGFITGLLNNWDLRKCGEFANAVGAHCVMKVGASSGIKTKEEILEFIKLRKGEY
jgi:sugar/nucleoside kinase (ribokinase family)